MSPVSLAPSFVSITHPRENATDETPAHCATSRVRSRLDAPAAAQVVNDWNVITMSCAVANRAGPTNQLDIALVQGAVHDAVQAIQGRFEPYHYVDPSRLGVGSEEAAVAAATYGVLRGLYGAYCRVPVDCAESCSDLCGGPADSRRETPPPRRSCLFTGQVFTLPTDPFVGGTSPGEWRPTPPALLPGPTPIWPRRNRSRCFVLISSGPHHRRR